MARHTFFSFHYERDAWRASQVRNSNIIPCEDEYGFVDSADWEEIKRKGNAAIEAWIAEQLEHTSVTAVLIGAETADREWVRHEIIESWNRGNGLVGIWIHNIKDQDGRTDTMGRNPFDEILLPNGTPLSSICKTYDWINDGRNNLGTWIEEAYQNRRVQSSDLIKKGSGAAAAIAAAVATAAVIASKHRQPAPTVFRPRAPWCNTDGNRR